MATHTHDGIDWTSRVANLRRSADVDAPALRAVAARLVERTPPGSTVLDIGCGAGGMSVAFIEALARRGGGTVVLVDAVPELLAAAESAARAAAAQVGDIVTVRTTLADLAAADELRAAVPPARLVWASQVVHHLPDQQAGLAALADLLVPGGCLALAEGGLSPRCLPWDLGVGEPGFADRLTAAWNLWFARMRAQMPGVRRLPVGWNRALTDVGLVGVTAFSFLVDRPAPLSRPARQIVIDWLTWMAEITVDLLADADAAVLRRLLDPQDTAYIGGRDDVFLLKATTVQLGWAP